jgi:transposase
MTLYIGIDVAKTFHIACFINSQGQRVAQLRFDNDATGFHQLEQTIQRLSLPEMESVLCGMESTGHYGIALRDFLIQLGYPVQVFNPLKVSCYHDALFESKVMPPRVSLSETPGHDNTKGFGLS